MAPTPEPINPTPSGICQPGDTRLQEFLMATYGGTNLGCYNPNSHLPSGAPSYHVHGQAIDIGFDMNDPLQFARAQAIANWCIAHADQWTPELPSNLNLQEMIWDHRLITARRWSEGIRVYTNDDHMNHIHIATGYLTSQDWQAPEEVDMTPAQAQQLADIHSWWLGANQEHTAYGRVMQELAAINLRLTDIENKVSK